MEQEEEKSDDVKHDVAFDEKGNLILKEKKKVKRGKVSRAAGAQFELRVRKDLEEKGWVVDKFTNNVDIEEGKIISAKRKMGFLGHGMRFMALGTGFPDFLAFKRLDEKHFKVVGVEVKMNGKLSKIEKEKCRWYIEKKIFSELWIARKEKDGRCVRVVYDEWIN